MSYRIFISHKNDDDSNEIGAQLGEFLKKKGHTVFFDKHYLKGGMTWQEKIIDNLLTSDVVIVILNEGTALSHWVQREIDMARARSISILPLTIAREKATVQDALDRFDLNATQFIKLEGIGIRVLETYEEIATLIEPLSEETLANQEDSVKAWREQRKPTEVIKKIGRSKPSSSAFTHPEAEGIIFHIATGDASRMRGYEVLVNTENNYMQMARFYQTQTLSYAVRKNGAYMSGARLIEDTIQTELYVSNQYTFPVPPTTVLATSAGHEKSYIKRNTDYRYILHGAAVRFEGAKTPPNQPVGRISELIENCLNRIHEIDKEQGEIIGKNNTIITSKDDDYKPITSILFPAFGAGEGGKEHKKVAIETISTFARDLPVCINVMKLSISDVGFSVYAESDVHEIENVFLIHGFVKV